MKRSHVLIHYAVVLLLLVVLHHQTCLAQVEPWQRVNLIEQGKRVHVKLHSGKTVKGKMESWNTDGLTIRQGKDKIVSLTKSDVAQVVMPIGMSRGRKAAYGGLIGGGIGAALFGAVCAGAEGGCYAPTAAVAAGAALWIGGIAAGIAALFPQHKEIIYRAESAQPRSGIPGSRGVGALRFAPRGAALLGERRDACPAASARARGTVHKDLGWPDSLSLAGPEVRDACRI